MGCSTCFCSVKVREANNFLQGVEETETLSFPYYLQMCYVWRGFRDDRAPVKYFLCVSCSNGQLHCFGDHAYHMKFYVSLSREMNK